MYQTIEAIVHPDGTIEPLEAIAPCGRRRALLTILDEAPATGAQDAPLHSAERLDAVLRAAGLLDDDRDRRVAGATLSDAARDALWERNRVGTPLSTIIATEHDEQT